ncbi:hypothetical protein B0H12DRAFT_102183 [Mycena haematopus]|nr:hypothetical protein B0H12DRAFT_102183 [Mycena haematopus]
MAEARSVHAVNSVLTVPGSCTRFEARRWHGAAPGRICSMPINVPRIQYSRGAGALLGCCLIITVWCEGSKYLRE